MHSLYWPKRETADVAARHPVPDEDASEQPNHYCKSENAAAGEWTLSAADVAAIDELVR